VNVGLCGCGCGGEAPIAPETDASKGWVKGRPLRFIRFHAARLLRFAPPEYTVNERGCWVWQHTKFQGYGIVRRERTIRAHRAYYEHFVGPIPTGLQIDHLCRNRACVNPAHLEPVTTQENTARRACNKLSPEQRAEIRANYRPGRKAQKEIGARYGVSGHYVYLLGTGRR
jgi:hypothetical protein